ncbi:MAG: YgjV family protein [Methanobrevibacter sp.]|jgi:hypothetical protein|nr:YgjV family protein [Methanobrevibacter sp.]
MNEIDILIRITGIIAIIFNITSVLINKKILIIFTILANIFFAAQFFLLGAYVAVFSCIVTSLAALVVHIHHSRDLKTPEIVLILFITIFILSGYFQSDIDLDGNDLLPILASIMVVFALENKNIITAKFYYLICAILWIIYDFNLHIIPWENVINQVFLIIFTVVTFLFYEVLNKKKTEYFKEK